MDWAYSGVCRGVRCWHGGYGWTACCTWSGYVLLWTRRWRGLVCADLARASVLLDMYLAVFAGGPLSALLEHPLPLSDKDMNLRRFRNRILVSKLSFL